MMLQKTLMKSFRTGLWDQKNKVTSAGDESIAQSYRVLLNDASEIPGEVLVVFLMMLIDPHL